MKKLIVSLVSVLVLSSTAYANNYDVTVGNGIGCSQNESSGETLSFSSAFNTDNNSAQVNATYTIQLGAKKLNNIDCGRIYDISVKKQELELQKAQLELDLLRAQIRQAQAAASSTLTLEDVTINSNDDW